MKLTRITTIAAAAALGLTSTAALAEEDAGHYYAGAHYFDWEVENTEGLDAKADTGRLLAGYMYNEYVGVELHAATGGTDELGDGVEAELDQLVGIFARLNMPMYNGWANLFGLVGYGRGEVDVTTEAGTTSVLESGFALGVGLEVAVIPNRLYVAADHVQYVNETGKGGLTGIEGTANSLGLRMNF